MTNKNTVVSVMSRRLTVKLRGRTEAPDGAEGAQFLGARGARPQAHHGPLQRLLGPALTTTSMLSSIDHKYLQTKDRNVGIEPAQEPKPD